MEEMRSWSGAEEVEEEGEKGYVVKGDVEEVEKGMLRRMRVNARICCCGS